MRLASRMRLTQVTGAARAHTFNNVRFYKQNTLISLHKYKIFLSICLRASVFIFEFTFLDSMVTLKKHLQKELIKEQDMALADF
jgi:hypothetical protein